ncbi:universal stress protein [Pseudonocardia sp. GCM10023141]|uniref:universal stress protein n=1 Tax=Pseudonocardia sp. GCM10023141 TaxID=3252653 RepID=UPI00360F7CDC
MSTEPGRRFERGTDGPLRIVAGLDGSDSSMRAVAYAAGLARRQNAELALVYVQPVALGMAVPTFAELTAQSGEAIATELRDEITTTAESLKDVYRIRWQFHVRRGDPFRELAAAAEELTADSVVVGASEALRHRVAGSIAARLIRLGQWPVTVVP